MSMSHKLLTGKLYLTREEAESLLQEGKITAEEYWSIAAYAEYEKATAEIAKLSDALSEMVAQLKEAQEKQSELLQFLLSNQDSTKKRKLVDTIYTFSIVNKYRLFSKKELGKALEELPF